MATNHKITAGSYLTEVSKLKQLTGGATNHKITAGRRIDSIIELLRVAKNEAERLILEAENDAINELYARILYADKKAKSIKESLEKK